MFKFPKVSVDPYLVHRYLEDGGYHPPDVECHILRVVVNHHSCDPEGSVAH